MDDGMRVQSLSEHEKIRFKSEERLVEMIWFGGISNELSSDVFHVTLDLDGFEE